MVKMPDSITKINLLADIVTIMLISVKGNQGPTVIFLNT